MTYDINQKFEFLQSLTSMVISDITPSLVVTGDPGLGKTFTVMSIVKSLLDEGDYVSFKGYSTARGLFNTLYDNNGKLIIFDDCDSVLEDKVALNILKSALDSYETRKISWMAKMARNDEYPQHFDFTGRIIFISNKDKSTIDGAILSRSLVVDLTMTPADKISRMKSILVDIAPEYDMQIKNDALSFLDTKRDSVNLNMRTLIMVSKIRYSYPENWESLAGYMINSMI